MTPKEVAKALHEFIVTDEHILDLTKVIENKYDIQEVQNEYEMLAFREYK